MAANERDCACCAARYRVGGDPIFVNNCHCRQCQQQTGSTSVVNAFFESDRITLLSGSLFEHVATAGSGARASPRKSPGPSLSSAPTKRATSPGPR